jgi:hypothetical protein
MKRNMKKNKKESLALEDPNFNTLIQLYNSFSDIKFLEKNHKYEICGEPAKISVSGLISKYEKPFDSQTLATRIAKKDGVPVEYVLEKWERNKNYSCHKGSEFHLYVENFLERRQIPIDRESIIELISGSAGYYKEDLENYYSEMALLIKNFKSFYDWWKEDHILIKSEFVVGDKSTGICGTIDNLSFNTKTKEFAIFDYKTNKEIKMDNQYGEKMLEPFSYIPKCEYSKYSLQLSLYKEIFERNTPFKISYCGIVWVAGKDDYVLYEPKDYKKEAVSMLNGY